MHTIQCLKWQKEFDDWVKQWPLYCIKCGAVGSWENRTRTINDGGACSACVEQGICPRCASTHTIFVEYNLSDYLRCNNCGWNELILIQSDPQAIMQSGLTCPFYECHEYIIQGQKYGECTPEFQRMEQQYG